MLRILLSLFLVLNIVFSNELEPSVEFLDEELSSIEGDDPFGESEDPLLEDSDPLASEDPLSQEDDTIKISINNSSEKQSIKVKLDQTFRSAGGSRYLLKEGISIGSTEDEEERSIFVNGFQLKAKIDTSDEDRIVFNFRGYLAHSYSEIKKQYTDEGAIQIREAYKIKEFDSSSLLYGIFIPSNGKLLFNSTSDVLAQTNSDAYDSLSVDNTKNPVIGFRYQYYFENSSLKAYFVPIKPSSSGTTYTEYKEDLDNSENNNSAENRTTLAPYVGLAFNSSNNYFDYGINTFYWFDTDNNISYWDSANASVSNTDSYSYKEEVSDLAFVSINLDANIFWDINLKSELTYFHDKNIYHFFQDSNNSNELTTYNIDMLAFGITLQKQFGDLTILPNYTYKYLEDVPKDTNILYYENRDTKAPNARNLIQHKYSLALSYLLNDDLRISTIYSQIKPVKIRSFAASIDYELDKSHAFSFRGVYFDTEKQKSSESKVISRTSYLEYKYSF